MEIIQWSCGKMEKKYSRIQHKNNAHLRNFPLPGSACQTRIFLLFSPSSIPGLREKPLVSGTKILSDSP
jgi:hypothetical protein